MTKKLVAYKETGFPTYDIDLKEEPELRWKDLCESELDNLASLISDVTEASEAMMGDLPLKLRPIVAGLSKPSGRVGAAIASLFGQDYVKEIKGIAKFSGLPYSHIFLANMMYDIVVSSEKGEQLWQKVGDTYQKVRDRFRIRGACSSYSTCVYGKPVLVRNMDWSVPETVGEHTRIVRFHSGKKSYDAVSILGSVGMLSAVSKGRWAITMNQAPLGNVKIGMLQWPAMHRIRNVCDQMCSFSSTVSKLREYQTMVPFFAHVVGLKPEQQVVIIGRGSENVLRKIDSGRLIQTNHCVGCHEDQNWAEDETDSYDRYNALKERLLQKPKTMKEAMVKMDDFPVTYEVTQHQMLLCPATGKLQLKIRI